jgi:hypothetical protein
VPRFKFPRSVSRGINSQVVLKIARLTMRILKMTDPAWLSLDLDFFAKEQFDEEMLLQRRRFAIAAKWVAG